MPLSPSLSLFFPLSFVPLSSNFLKLVHNFFLSYIFFLFHILFLIYLFSHQLISSTQSSVVFIIIIRSSRHRYPNGISFSFFFLHLNRFFITLRERVRVPPAFLESELFGFKVQLRRILLHSSWNEWEGFFRASPSPSHYWAREQEWEKEKWSECFFFSFFISLGLTETPRD